MALTEEERNIFGLTTFRGKAVKFGIKTDDRRRHMYVIGKTGSGKSKLLEVMAINDIRAGKGMGIVDPHGEFAEAMLDYIPEDRVDDVIYFSPADSEFPIAFNPLEKVSTEFRHLIASGIMGVFKKIWVDAWSARMEYILNNTLLAMLEYPETTILGVMRMFSEPEYRKKIVEGLKDPVIKAFWQNEYARYSQRFETEAVAAIQNKIGQFVSNPLIRNIIGQPHSAINMREIMDSKKIFIANLSKGKIGEDNSALLGAMIISRIQLAAMSRVDIPEEMREDFFLYVDEFQNFATDSFASILSEARKYHLSLTLAHQYIEQLDEKVRPAVFGNVGTIVSFRVGAFDAEFLEKEFTPEFEATDLVNLEKRNVYIKLLIDGVASHPFSARSIDKPPPPEESFKDVIIENTRNRYGLRRLAVEEKIAAEWLTTSAAAVGQKLERRSERPLGRTLQGNAQVISKSPFRPERDRNRPQGNPYPNRNPASEGQRGEGEGERREPSRSGGEAPRPLPTPKPLPPKEWAETQQKPSGTEPRRHVEPPDEDKQKATIDDLRKALSERLAPRERNEPKDEDTTE